MSSTFCSFAKDSCSAFKDFQQNPHNSSLSLVVPCVASAYSDQTLVEIGYTVHNFITKVLNWLKYTNTHITRVFMIHFNSCYCMIYILFVCIAVEFKNIAITEMAWTRRRKWWIIRWIVEDLRPFRRCTQL